MSQHPTLSQAGLLIASLMLIAVIAVFSTAYQARERLIEARYGTAVETAHDLEANLQFVAQELERDLHFLTELPLMTAIIESHRAIDRPADPDEQEDAAADDSDQATVTADAEEATPNPGPVTAGVLSQEWTQRSPQQWLDRQGELFDGFLNANPAYLMLATCVYEADGAYRELSRSERVSAGLQAHRIPKKQLLIARADPTSEIGNLQTLRPGEVLLSTNDQISEEIPINSRSALVLTGVSPTFDAEGDFFGVNVIESDLRNRLDALLPTLVPRHVNVSVTDADGRIVLDYQGGRLIEPRGVESVKNRFPSVERLFNEDAGVTEAGDGRTVFATVAQLGSLSSRARIGIITYVSENTLP
jgi:hypothetical protein